MRSVLLAGAIALFVLVSSAAATAGLPRIEARAYYVRGGVDGAVLAERSAHERRSIASITKLMTVLVALDHAALDDVVTVGPDAAGIGESTIFLRPGQRISVRDLAIGALVPSANDAATALAVHAGGSVARFVTLMNRKARALGLHDTRFANPHGLDQRGHRSSARDVTALLVAALRDPFIRKWSSRPSAVISGGRVVESTDGLIGRLPQLVGGKTGHTNDAGWSQVAAAQEGGVRVAAAVLGAPTEEQRDRELEALLRWGLAQYRPIRAIDSSRAYALVHMPYGRSAVRLVARTTIVRAARVGRPLLERIVAPTGSAFPVRAGELLGEVRVYDGERLVAVSPLVADRTVTEPGVSGKIGWYARRTLHHLVGVVS
jgi:D-alanyl-D-alanine carboxypeptidase (penicillin-binding protein 5/6)